MRSAIVLVAFAADIATGGAAGATIGTVIVALDKKGIADIFIKLKSHT